MGSSEAPKTKVRFVSLRVKLLIGFTALFSVVFAAAFIWFYDFATDQAIGRIEEDLAATLQAAVSGIDGGTFAALAHEAESREDGLTDDSRYWEHLAWLETVHNLEPRAYPYSYVRGEGENETLFIGDILVVTDPDGAADFREPYVSKGPMYRGLTEFTLHTDDPYTDKWGSWVSAYAPIEDVQGNRVGALGVDFQANYVVQVQQAIRDRVLVAFGVTYAALFVLVFAVTGAFTRRVGELTGVAERVADGDYDQDLTSLHAGSWRDEVSTLAEVFVLMISKVRRREQSLKQQVRELRIEIDQTKKARQVAEITETDYFRRLREQAARLRDESGSA